jgi:DNA-directed RNA polymerase subunit M/transcription elongation factor TFIIS
MDREAGKSALATILKKPTNVKILEEKISKISSPETYSLNIYQVVGDILAGNKLVDIMASLKKNHVEWDHEMYNNVRFKIQEQDEFTECPFEVEEGVLTCKCGSSKVFSYCKQSKGGDEGTTSYAKCMKCDNSWTEG